MIRKTAVVVILLMTTAVRADVMNLNEFVPTHLEDASPINEHDMIVQLSSQFERDDSDDMHFRPDIRYGFTKRLQAEIMTEHLSGGEEKQSGESRIALLYMLNESENAFPIVSINPLVHIPTGKESRGLDTGVKIILTSTLEGTSERAETELHLNYELLHNAARRPGERAEESIFAFGISHRMLDNLALVFDYSHQDDINQDTVEEYLEAGLHHKIMDGFFLSYGAGKGVSPSTPDWMAILTAELEL